ncbi:hypothetical protein DdX_00644 [Ditylenchus destructor]|uniref:Uncharacterized protein n=1 Tax=Ditylenchus destructor TaxID=166010 RepID=A0AAD4NJ35_9BILA|nr:hypothetical protein DdX_00644 [Ditylenchus destructor]
MEAARLKKKRFKYTALEERKMWHFFVNELRTGSIRRTGIMHLWKRYAASGQSTKHPMGLESQLERKFRCRIYTTKDAIFCRARSRDKNNPFEYPTLEEINTILRDDGDDEKKDELSEDGLSDDEPAEKVNDEKNMDSTESQQDSQFVRSSDSDQQPILSKKAKENVKAPSRSKERKDLCEKGIQCNLVVVPPLRIFTTEKQTNSAFNERRQTLLSNSTAESSDRTHSPILFCNSDDNDFLSTQCDRRDIVVYAPDSQVKKPRNVRNSREIELEELVVSSPDVSSTQTTNNENLEGRDSVSSKVKKASRRCLNIYEAHARNLNIERSDTSRPSTHGQILHEYENQSVRKSVETSSTTDKGTDDSSGIADRNIHKSISSKCPNPQLVHDYKSRLTNIFKNAFPAEKDKHISTGNIFDGFSPIEQDCLKGIHRQIEWLRRDDGFLPNRTS